MWSRSERVELVFVRSAYKIAAKNSPAVTQHNSIVIILDSHLYLFDLFTSFHWLFFTTWSSRVSYRYQFANSLWTYILFIAVNI